jgi:hypothetical protein
MRRRSIFCLAVPPWPPGHSGRGLDTHRPSCASRRTWSAARSSRPFAPAPLPGRGALDASRRDGAELAVRRAQPSAPSCCVNYTCSASKPSSRPARVAGSEDALVLVAGHGRRPRSAVGPHAREPTSDRRPGAPTSAARRPIVRVGTRTAASARPAAGTVAVIDTAWTRPIPPWPPS